MEDESNVENNSMKKVSALFHVLCWSATTSVVSYWIYKYSLNDDLCVVDYKKFYEDPTNHYPMLSLCFENPFSSNKLNLISPEINETTYLQFLRGEYFSPEMLEIDYENVTIDIAEYVKKYFVYWRDGSMEVFKFQKQYNLFETTFSGFLLTSFLKCYGLKIPPDGDTQQFGVQLKNEIFPNSIRPTSVAFSVILHYPNQLLRSLGSMHFMWPEIKSNNTYETIFRVNKMEMIERRNKGTRPCHDSDNHDDMVLVHHTNKVGCTPPYLKPSKMIRRCTTENEMKEARFRLRSDDYDIIPPCRAMEKISYTHLESDLSGTIWEGSGHFWISSSFYDKRFLEIIKTRYYFLYSHYCVCR